MISVKQISYRQVTNFLVIALAATIQMRFAWASIHLMIFFAVLLFGWATKRASALDLKNPLLILPLLVFVFHVISAFLLSDDMDYALVQLRKKLPLLVYPLLFFGLRKFFDKNTLKWFSTTFVVATTLLTGWALIQGVNVYFSSGSFPVYHELSGLVKYHAIYLSLYCSLSIFLLQTELKRVFQQRLFWRVIWQVYFFSLIILLASKTILAVTLVVLFVLSIKPYLANRKYIKAIAVSLVSALVLVAVLSSSFLGKRYQDEFYTNLELAQQDHFTYDSPFTGLTIRLVIWKISFEILSEDKAFITGVGIGDFQNKLNQKYLDKGIYSGNINFGDKGYQGYNAHNQYVQFLLTLGVIGLVVFLAWIILLLRVAWLESIPMLLITCLVFCALGVSESFMESQRGLMPFITISTLTYLVYTRKYGKQHQQTG